MKRLASPWALVAGCVVIVVANAVILGSAAFNRLGGVEAQLRLTERELVMPPYRQEGNSGLTLSLVPTSQAPAAVRRAARWKRQELPEVGLAWLDREKLRELGCRVELDPTDRDAEEYYVTARPRRAYVVLEFEGRAWERWIAARDDEVSRLRERVKRGEGEPERLADTEALLALDRTMRSRLFPVDAGRDARTLRARYGERDRYAIVEAMILPRLVRGEIDPPSIGGKILLLPSERVFVQPRFGRTLAQFRPTESRRQTVEREREDARLRWPAPTAPRYEVELSFGRRLEPWLSGVKLLGPSSTAEAGSTAPG